MNKHKSITVNSIWYLIYQVFNVLFPFITTLYVARVILPEGVGKVLSAQNIASYFAILAFLGIPTYGRREISKARNDKAQLSKIYSELLVINSISTLCFVLLYLALIFIIPDFRNNLALYLITGGSIALNFLNNTWLFEGIEDFKFISIRNIVFKAVSFILLVLLVHDKDDYLYYALVTVLGTAGNYILNFMHAPHIASFSIKGIDLKRHMKPIFALVAVNIAIELYSLVDVTMIKFLSGETNVAYYSYAQGINKILQQVINTFTIVVVPRLALYYKEHKNDEFASLLSKTLNTLIVLSLPMIAGVEVVAHTAIVAMYGIAYEPSVPVLRILITLLIVTPIGYLLGSRVLLIVERERQMARVVWAGAIVNIIGNFILIPLFIELGAAIASVTSELIVAIVYVILGRKYVKPHLISSEVIKIIIGTIIMTATTIGLGLLTDNLYISLTIQVLGGVISYFTTLLLIREDMVIEYYGKIRARLTT